MPKPVDKDARMLGLALLHGYVEASELEAAARLDPRPCAILKSLQNSGILDEPCLQGLKQGLEDMGSDPSLPLGPTSSTRAFPHIGPDSTSGGMEPGQGRPRPLDSSEEDGPDHTILRKFTIARWKQYRNLRFIGEGGMGRLFKAVDPDLNRTVALKFLRGQDPGQLRRFLFEAQAQALVEHPNICQVHEVSEWQGQHYISMQYVNGPTLSKVREELTQEQKLELMETVARAVHEAHRRGLIHRDLKPTNILVEREAGGRLRPFIVDFGLARDSETRDLTLSGLVVGTTAYMAPEQAKGEAHHIDRRTDVYSLGATLYELFAGCPPFGDAKGMDCLRMVVEEDPPPLRHLAPGVHPDLETIVSKCLEKDPSRRYDDALALGEDLRRFREGDPILARPATLRYRLGKFARKNRALVVVSTIAAAALVVLAGVAAYARINATARELAAQHFSQEAERIEALLGYAKRLPLQDIDPRLEKARQRLTRLQEEVNQSRGNAAGSGAYAVGRALLAFGEVDGAKPLLERAEKLGLQTPELASALGRCYAAIYQRELERARRMNTQQAEKIESRESRIRKVEEMWREPALRQLRQAKLLSREPQEYLEALVAWYEGRIDAALSMTRSAVQHDPSHYEAKGLEGELLLALARQEKDRGSVGQAREHLQAASRIFTEAQRVAPCDVSLWLGEAKVNVEYLRGLQAGERAETYLSRCREVVQTCLQIQPSSNSPKAQIAAALYWSGLAGYSRGQNAEPLLREGIALAEEVLAKSPAEYDAHVARIGLYDALGRSLRHSGEDPMPAFVRSMDSTRAALVHHPQDWLLLSKGIEAAQTKMTWEGNTGKAFEQTFHHASAMAENLLQQDPAHPLSHYRMASLHIERADIEMLHGIDPRPSLDKAQAFMESARRANLDDRFFLTSSGDIWLARGQYALTCGGDPTRDLTEALEYYKARLAIPAVSAGNFGNVAEASFYLGLYLAQQGIDPSPWVLRAQEALRQGFPRDNYYWLHQLRGQCAWLMAVWSVGAGKDSRPHFDSGIKSLQHACELGKQAASYRWLARLYRDRAKCFNHRTEEVRSGLKAAEIALNRDPSSGEGTLLKGQLIQLLGELAKGREAPGANSEGLRLAEKALALDANLKPRWERYLKGTRNRCTPDL